MPGLNKRIKRRTLLVGAVTSAIIAVVKSTTGQLVSAFVPDPTKPQGTPSGTLGTTSPFEHPVKLPSDISARTPLQDLYGMITPPDLHFERNHAGVPAIQPDNYKLIIHGMVDKLMVFTLAALKRFPSVARIAFL
jgi:sulfane dehydrogenase subunit SoxC